MNDELIATIVYDMKKAEAQAWKSLAGYKFLMFGYHAAVWVNLNKLLPVKQPNPFASAVEHARQRREPKGKCPGCGCNIDSWIQER